MYYLLAVLFLLLPMKSFAVEVFPMSDSKNTLVIADFDTWKDINNLGEKFMSWGSDPSDTTQGCKIKITDAERLGTKGNCVRLMYDVDSPRSAYNGMAILLGSVDFSQYKYLVLSIKGDEEAEFTPRLKIDVKPRKGEPGSYIITGITGEWKQFVIPIKDFDGLEKLRDMREITIIFDDLRCEPMTGTIYIDSIYLSK